MRGKHWATQIHMLVADPRFGAKNWTRFRQCGEQLLANPSLPEVVRRYLKRALYSEVEASKKGMTIKGGPDDGQSRKAVLRELLDERLAGELLSIARDHAELVRSGEAGPPFCRIKALRSARASLPSASARARCAPW